MDEQDGTDGGCARTWRRGHVALMLAVAATWLTLSGMNLWMGELNQDEGWYLYAAGQIREGRLPYRDFAFTQPPMLPLVYSWAHHWVERFGVAGGRALTWILGAMGVLSATWLAMRCGPRRIQRMTGGLAFILMAVNIYQSYFTTIVKTYSLSGLFLATGLLMLSFVRHRKAFRFAFGAGILLACAAATRITLGAALGLGFLYLLAIRHRVKPWAWLDFLLGGLLGLSLVLLPFYAMGAEGFRFGILEYHVLRDGGPWIMQAAFKIGCLSRLAQAYLPAVCMGLFLLIAAVRSLFLRRGTPPEAAREEPGQAPPYFSVLLWATIFVLGLAHLAAPFPYDDYQVPVYPVYCAALAAVGARWWLRIENRRFASSSVETRSARRLFLLTAAWLACSLHAFSSPMVQNWFVAGRDRIWWRLRGQSPMAQLRDVARRIRDETVNAGGAGLFTQDTYLAVEAGLRVPRGLEMGPFSYYPDWSRDRAERIGVVNREMLLELLSGSPDFPMAAISGYGLAIRSPEVEEVVAADRQAFQALLSERYIRVETVPLFGQAGTPLDLWQLRESGATAVPGDGAGEVP